jgi:hypothetical protein
MDYRDAPVDSWWRLMTGGEPEQVTRNTASLQVVAEGPFSIGRLALAVSPGRVDWAISSLPPSPGQQWPTVGTWPQCIQEFIPAVLEWLPAFTSMVRLAFGAVVVLPVPDRAKGYRILESALSDLRIQLPEGISDFLLQLNQPLTPSSSPGMTINRVTRWSVALLAPVWVQVAITPNAPGNISVDTSRPQTSAVRVELDFNTPADWSQPIALEQAQGLVPELTRLAAEYVRERIK